MSQGWAVRSKGAPYFCFAQGDFASMRAALHAPGERGSFRVALEVAVETLPTLNASADEVHRLFSYADTGAGSASDLLSLGITPSGRIVGLTPSGGLTQTTTGVIVADGTTHELALEYEPVVGFATLLLDGVELVLLNSVASGFPQPASVGFMTLFNGIDGLTRCTLRIRKVTWTEYKRTITWAIDEGFDRLLKATTTADTSDPGVIPFVQDFDLTANFITGVEPWGPWDGNGDPRGDYSWVLSTAYSRVAPPVTVYERTQA